MSRTDASKSNKVLVEPYYGLTLTDSLLRETNSQRNVNDEGINFAEVWMKFSEIRMKILEDIVLYFLKCLFFTIGFIKINGSYIYKILNSKFQTKTSQNMKVAYFQHFEGEEKVYIKINFKENNLDRIFSFERRLCENVVGFLNRLDNKVLYLFERKTKKQKKKAKEESELHILDGLCGKHSCLLLNNQHLSNDVKFQDIFQNSTFEELKLRILDSDYDVVINAPMIVNMSLPKQILVGSVVIPEISEAQFTDTIKSDYTWLRSLTPFKPKSWEKCGEGSLYSVKEDDKNYFLKLICIPKKDNKVGPPFDVISNSAVEEFKSYEEIRKRHMFTKERTKHNEFRVVSYNILADTYTKTKEAKEELFTFCNPAYLDFSYRKNLLNIELLGYNADIICLQEVDVKLYQNNLKLLFDVIGYSSVFSEKDGAREGCLFIYDKKKFNFIGCNQYKMTEELMYNPLFEDIREKIQFNEKLVQRLANVSSQILITVLEFLPEQILVVGNTHFYFHPDADHIRLLQGVISLRILLNTVEELQKTNQSKKISLILCGDLNSTPECGFHQLLNSGSVGSDHIDWKSKADEAIENLAYCHPLKMKSAYGNTQYTNYTPLFKGCLDYIYYQTDHVELKQTVPVPDENVLSQCSGGIPSEFFPSDHVALIADFKFKGEE